MPLGMEIVLGHGHIELDGFCCLLRTGILYQFFCFFLMSRPETSANRPIKEIDVAGYNTHSSAKSLRVIGH